MLSLYIGLIVLATWHNAFKGIQSFINYEWNHELWMNELWLPEFRRHCIKSDCVVHLNCARHFCFSRKGIWNNARCVRLSVFHDNKPTERIGRGSGRRKAGRWNPGHHLAKIRRRQSAVVRPPGHGYHQEQAERSLYRPKGLELNKAFYNSLLMGRIECYRPTWHRPTWHRSTLVT